MPFKLRGGRLVPIRGDSVWLKGFDQPNARISTSDFEAETAVVESLAREDSAFDNLELSFDDFDGTWDDAFGGVWRIESTG
jgi:hypothetical protein